MQGAQARAQYVLARKLLLCGHDIAAATAVADIGLNADLSTVAGSTTTGTSAAALDMATKATTATLQWKILGSVQRVDNEPTGNATKVLVKINNAVMGGGTGATGVWPGADH